MKSLPCWLTVAFFFFVFAALSRAQPAGFNYDESQVPHFELPDPLIRQDGTSVKTPKDWTRRRAEILELFQHNMYGVMPERPAELNWQVVERSEDALNGTAIRKQVTIFFTKESDGPRMDLLLYVPKTASGPAPAFVGCNFGGNQTTHADPQIRLATIRSQDGEPKIADESTRGQKASRWQIDTVVAAGYAIGTVYYGDIDPDYFDNFQNGVHRLYPELQNREDNFTSIGAWAWGLSRVLDYLEHDEAICAARVAVIGHSRLGKTALWAGANDERFAVTISNDSGCGGAALSRRRFGETVERINTVFPHWFCEKFKTYNDNEDALPLDQHMLIALIAPRPVYVASAVEDKWADPRGEFLSAKFASPVYELLGKTAMPEQLTVFVVGEPVHTTIGYHCRQGKHDVTAYDWQQYLTFADQHLRQ